MRRDSATRRAVVCGYNGAVATSQPLAAQAGLRMLLMGGNAIDAAIAAAATLAVVEPMSTGLGGDVFALIYWAKDRRVYALNASGRAPGTATVEAFRQRGLDRVPVRGILPVTVPGAPAGWTDLSARFGHLGLARALQPAIAYAEEGFPVSKGIARSWQEAEGLLREFPETARVMLKNGHAPRFGERFSIPDLAQSLRTLAQDGPTPFYRGSIAQAIVATSKKLGGLLSLDDLATHTSTWVEPIVSDYRGYSVYECPPNGQGIAVLIALNILKGWDLSTLRWDSPPALHLKMEALKLAMADAARYVADPDHAFMPIEELLSESYAQERRMLIREGAVIERPHPGRLPTSHDTVYLCTADAEGNAVSFINSLYMGFGSGIVAEGTGILLQNRGNLFSLNPEHPNCIAPHKRPYHTIIPGMVTHGDKLRLCFGVMGGFMQPQGQVQVLSNIIDHGMDVQEAIDAPRFNYDQGRRFAIEPYFPSETLNTLQEWGHDLDITALGNFGGGQAIMVDPTSGALLAGSDSRKDGCALVF